MTNTIGQREKLAIAHRFEFLKNAALDGFSDGIDYDRLTAGTDWALRGVQGREPAEDLISLFAAPWQAAKDEGEFDGDCRAEALKDIARIGEEAAALSSPPAGEGEPVPYILGNSYMTLAGEMVRFVKVHNEGNSYETMEDEAGVNRYTRRDFGRVTGTAHDYSDPRNTPPLYAHPPSAGEEKTGEQMKMLVGQEWLARHVASDPDSDVEVSPLSPTSGGGASMRAALADLVSWFDGGPSSHGPWIIQSGALGADDAVAAARAALSAAPSSPEVIGDSE